MTNAGIRPGETVYFPAAGSLPADSGEREVAILFRPGAALGALGGAAGSSRTETLYRAKARAGPQQQQQQQQIPGGGVRQQEEQAAQDAATIAVPAGEYNVTVRLRYR